MNNFTELMVALIKRFGYRRVNILRTRLGILDVNKPEWDDFTGDVNLSKVVTIYDIKVYHKLFTFIIPNDRTVNSWTDSLMIDGIPFSYNNIQGIYDNIIENFLPEENPKDTDGI